MFEQQYDSRQGQIGVDENSTVECPYCHADILSSNQVIHEAHCARQHRNGNERQLRPEPIQRQGSSSEISNVPDSMRQPQIRREDRRMVENKLITCPNCEKSVREQNFANHVDNECEGHDKIPCEFCDQLVPMSSYTEHVDSCPRRREEEQNRRQASPPRNQASERQEPRQNEAPQESANRNQQPHGAQQGRSRSAEQGSSQEPGGFLDFLHGIASAAYNSFTNRNDDQNSEQQQQQQRQEQQRQEQQRQQQQRQQQQSGDHRSLLSRLLGGPSEQDHQHRPDQRPRNAPTNARPRATTPPVQHPFDPFGLFTDSRPAPQRRSNEGYSLVRTVERAPNGSLVVRMRMVPTEQLQGMQQTRSRPQQMESEDMGPMGLLLNMLSGQNGGMQGMNFMPMGGDMAQEAPRGLNKEVLDSLSVVKYDKERNKNVGPEAKSCPICLEEFDNGDSVRYLWCMHRFHMNCVDNWFKEHTNCPICKKEFSEVEHQYDV